jgi:tetratricopeptide (TPR) repeat protein
VQALVVALLQLAQTDAERAQARIAEALEANVQVRSAEAEAAARQALAHAERAGDYALRVRASQQLANAWAQLGRTGAAVTLMTPLLDGLRARVDPATERSVLSDFAFVLEHADRRTEAVALRERIIDLATAQSDWSLAHVALTDQAISVYYLGELERSTALYEQARLLRDRLGPGRGWSVMDDMGLAGNLRELGCYRRALAMTEDALQTMRQGGFAAWALNTENDLAIAYLQLGQTQRAVRLLRELPEDAPAFVHAGRYAARARIERLRKGAAVALWQRALDLAVAAGVRQFVRLKLEIELCRDLEPAAGLPRLDALQAEAQWRECGGLQRLALLYRADALRRSGDTAAAAAAAQAVAAAHTARAPIVIYPAELWWMLFQALDAGGDRSGAEQALRRGYDWIQAALSEVPEEFRDSFLNRNPINRAITLAA